MFRPGDYLVIQVVLFLLTFLHSSLSSYGQPQLGVQTAKTSLHTGLSPYGPTPNAWITSLISAIAGSF